MIWAIYLYILVAIQCCGLDWREKERESKCMKSDILRLSERRENHWELCQLFVSCFFLLVSLCSVVVAVAASGTSHYLQNLLRYVSFEKFDDVSRLHYPILKEARAQFRSMHNAHNQIKTTKTTKNVVWRAKRRKKKKRSHQHRSWAMLMVIVSIQSECKYHFVLFGMKK